MPTSGLATAPTWLLRLTAQSKLLVLSRLLPKCLHEAANSPQERTRQKHSRRKDRLVREQPKKQASREQPEIRLDYLSPLGPVRIAYSEKLPLRLPLIVPDMNEIGKLKLRPGSKFDQEIGRDTRR